MLLCPGPLYLARSILHSTAPSPAFTQLTLPFLFCSPQLGCIRGLHFSAFVPRSKPSLRAFLHALEQPGLCPCVFSACKSGTNRPRRNCFRAHIYTRLSSIHAVDICVALKGTVQPEDAQRCTLLPMLSEPEALLESHLAPGAASSRGKVCFGENDGYFNLNPSRGPCSFPKPRSFIPRTREGHAQQFKPHCLVGGHTRSHPLQFTLSFRFPNQRETHLKWQGFASFLLERKPGLISGIGHSSLQGSDPEHFAASRGWPQRSRHPGSCEISIAGGVEAEAGQALVWGDLGGSGPMLYSGHFPGFWVFLAAPWVWEGIFSLLIAMRIRGRGLPASEALSAGCSPGWGLRQGSTMSLESLAPPLNAMVGSGRTSNPCQVQSSNTRQPNSSFLPSKKSSWL